jgi:hypothetical protein
MLEIEEMASKKLCARRRMVPHGREDIKFKGARYTVMFLHG